MTRELNQRVDLPNIKAKISMGSWKIVRLRQR